MAAVNYTLPSRFIWAACALSLATAALAAPLLQAHHHALAALALREFFSRLCHQRATRSLALNGLPTAVCARCLGIYTAAGLGCLLRLRRESALVLFVTAIVFNAADVAAESASLHPNITWMRFFLGAALGLAAATLLTSSQPANEHCTLPSVSN